MATRTFDVVALQVPIAFDAYGDHDRNGMIYTLAEHEEELRAVRDGWPDPFPDPVEEPGRLPVPHPLVRPLVLRARVGERVVVRFRNELSRRAGIHPQGVGFDVARADGGKVGVNPDSAVAPGRRRRYEWDCDTEGVFFFGDLADLRGDEHGSQAHGLFGALVVEPVGATWTDPVTGAPLRDGLYADVHVPGEASFREYAVFMQDESPNDNPVDPPHPLYSCDRPRPHTHAPAAGGEPLLPELFPQHGGHGGGHGGGAEPMSMMLMSYRTEPMGWRSLAFERLLTEGKIDPARDAIVGEEQHHSSWLFGDPVTPILRAYPGDRARIRLVHAGVKETHVFHLHLHQWRAVPGNESSPIIDSITIGPQQAFTVEPIGGAGSVQRATGDIIWHCHLYPHFHAGMWGIWRVFDVAQDGTGAYPDGTPIAALQPLPGHAIPPAPTPERPGFPAFIAGRFPQRSPRPPRTPLMPAGMGREPSALEAAAFCEDPQPGEAFTKVTLDPQAPVRRYDLVVMTATLHYYRSTGDGHEQGHGTSWHDHRGVFYVLQDELDEAGGVEAFQEQLAAGTRQVAPIAIRAAKGEIVELSLTNALPPGCHEETAFDPVVPFQPECGLHVHLVKFDPLASDGSCVGWNYLTGTTTADAGPQDHARYRTWIYRWYCDEDFGVVFFHDHLLANERQRHGLFGALIAEPDGAVWTDPADPHRQVTNSPQATVTLPDGTAFREQVLAVADFVPLVAHAHGHPAEPINPPAFPGALDDQGAMGISYRCEPLHERPGDPADWFSSAVHGDPGTPILPAYPGEQLRIRLYQGSHEEQHSFTAHGLRWPAWPADPTSPRRDQQTIGISEAFTLHLDEPHGPGDHLWSLAANDDTWLGCWGLVRLHDTEQHDLPPLPGAFHAAAALPPFDPDRARSYHVHARPHEITYSPQRSDPHGLVFHLDGAPAGQPLVLRARAGEWVEITLTNDLPGPPPPSRFDPPLPAKDDPGQREISARVSLHPGPLRYDVRTSDGANVGHNTDGTVKPGQSITYRWYADTPGPVLLVDRADVRTHRHRGLIGALIVEPPRATPHAPGTRRPRWTGEQATLRRRGHPAEHELVLLLQDGLRHYHHGDLTQPVRDLEDEPEDSGQKALNYRSAHLLPARPTLAVENPGTPLLHCRPGDTITLHLLVAADRPRNHSFHLHGHTWPMEDHLHTPRVGAIGGLTTNSVRTLHLTAGQPGDYAYRTGVLRWALTEGLWGIIRVQ